MKIFLIMITKFIYVIHIIWNNDNSVSSNDIFSDLKTFVFKIFDFQKYSYRLNVARSEMAPKRHAICVANFFRELCIG